MTKSYLLVTNDIIVGGSDGIVKDGKVSLMYPALLVHQRTSGGALGFMLNPWLPTELLRSSSVEIDPSKIISELLLSPSMERFYNNWALAERDKQTAFVEVFERQITEIERSYLERNKSMKEYQQKTPMVANTSLTNALIDLFDDNDHSWGDPTINN